MDLFIQPHVEFEKTAAEVDLPEDPNAWPKEILDELYKQVPYISDFHPHVVMDRVDSERRYGMGHINISNQSQTALGTDPNMMAAVGVRTVRIPVIIRDGKLSPFDLLVNDQSKVIPLTESRLRQAIFRPQAFDVTSQTPGDQSMIGQLYPPQREAGGLNRGLTLPAGDMGKMGSALEQYLMKEAGCGDEKKSDGAMLKDRLRKEHELNQGGKKTASILKEILPTINKDDLDGFWEKVSSDRGLQAQFRKNAQASSFLLGLLAQYEPLTGEKIASALPGYIKPSVVQIARHEGSYKVKTASHAYWKPFEQRIDRRELVQRFGEKVALAADEAGAVTLAEDADAEAPDPQVEGDLVTEPGVYKVTTTDGQELIGFVIPNLYDTDGTQLPLSLFTNGSQATVQSEIHGQEAGEGANLPTGPAQGMGAFFAATPAGLQATVPMSLSGSYEGEGEPTTFSGETFDGRPVEVSIQPNIQEPVGMEDGKLLLPMHWQWSPMDQAADVALVGSEDTFGGPDLTEPEEKEAMVYIRASNHEFSFEGPAVEKLATAEKNFLDVDGAMFLLAGLGVEQGYGTEKLAHALTTARPEPVKVARALTPASEVNKEVIKTASEKLASYPVLRKNLIKEASVIADPMAVDTVLSLGFINPENMMTFVSYLPQIDEAQMKMCEVLLATRLGLQNVPESAIERAVRSTEEVIEGLRIIAFSE